MYCERCNTHYFGGSVCLTCGGPLLRGVSTFSMRGELQRRGQEISISQTAPPHLKSSEKAGVGRSAGILVRLCYKILESLFACVRFSVALRVIIFLVKVIDSLMETGGDIKEGISFYADMQMGIGWYEKAAWVLIVILIFRYRHRPE